MTSVVIDSMPPDHHVPMRDRRDPDALVAPYLGARAPDGFAGRWLGGARYAILDVEYAATRPSAPARLPRRALLSCGGSDADGLSLPAARALARAGLHVDVVVGPLFDVRARTELVEWCAADTRRTTHDAPESLATLIARADVIVGRPGLLRYEAAALGRYGVYLARGPAYRDYYAGFAAAGLAEISCETCTAERVRFIGRLAALGRTTSCATRHRRGACRRPRRRTRRAPYPVTERARYPMTLNLEGHVLGPHERALLVAELSANHDRDLERALRLVDVAADAGWDCLKLQTYDADSLTLRSEHPAMRVDPIWGKRDLHELYADAGMPMEFHAPLFERARMRGLLPFTSVYDPRDLDFVEALGCALYKIASFELTFDDLLAEVGATGKPVILSTGMATFAEVAHALETLDRHGAGPVVLLHCCSSYPAPIDEINLRSWRDGRRRVAPWGPARDPRCWAPGSHGARGEPRLPRRPRTARVGRREGGADSAVALASRGTPSASDASRALGCTPTGVLGGARLGSSACATRECVRHASSGAWTSATWPAPGPCCLCYRAPHGGLVGAMLRGLPAGVARLPRRRRHVHGQQPCDTGGRRLRGITRPGGSRAMARRSRCWRRATASAATCARAAGDATGSMRARTRSISGRRRRVPSTPTCSATSCASDAGWASTLGATWTAGSSARTSRRTRPISRRLRSPSSGGWRPRPPRTSR